MRTVEIRGSSVAHLAGKSACHKRGFHCLIYTQKHHPAMAYGTITIESVGDFVVLRTLGFDSTLPNVTAEVTCHEQFVASSDGESISATTMEVRRVVVYCGRPSFATVINGRIRWVTPRGPWALTITRKR